MKFDKLLSELLEGFNVYPQSQNAINSGPDQGMTSGDFVNTFPSMMSTVRVTLPRKRSKSKKKKYYPKGRRPI